MSTKNLLKGEIQKDKELGKIISNCLDNGEPFPDDMLNNLVATRLKQSDCKVNGWVLEGFPYTRNQINLLKALKIRPSTVFLFEGTEEESVRRLGNRKVDPDTGICYNLEVSPPSEEAISQRLVDQPQDSEKTVRHRYQQWKK